MKPLVLIAAVLSLATILFTRLESVADPPVKSSAEAIQTPAPTTSPERSESIAPARVADLERSVKDLKIRVTDLERLVGVLSLRADALERRFKADDTPRPVAADKRSWRQLRKGMTESEVRNLLGEPKQIQAGGILSYWFYSDAGALGPKVSFDSDMTVWGWTEPK